MLSLSTVLLFSLAAILLALTPGPDLLYIATRSISQGRNAGICSALGVHTGVLVHTIAAALGFSALIAASELAFNIVRYAGAAYLVYLGIRTILDKSGPLDIEITNRSRLTEIFYQGLMTNVCNPKVILFFLAFLPQFVDPSKGHVPLQLFLLGCLMIVVTFPVDLSVALLGGTIRRFLKNNKTSQAISKWLTGSVFISLGVTTALFVNRKS